MESPNRDPFRTYWTKEPEGLAKWAEKPHPFTALVSHLRKHMSERHAKGLAAKYFHIVFKIWPGERFGKNPAGPG